MVMYKVIGVGERGKYFDDNSYYDVISYIFNHSAYSGGVNIASLRGAAEEMESVTELFHKTNGKKLRHSVLSFEGRENVTPEKAAEYAEQLMQHYANEFQMVYAVHTNTDEIHIHFVMNYISFVDGHRYDGKRKDYYSFQKWIKIVTGRRVIMSK